jgi:hypothetical protein
LTFMLVAVGVLQCASMAIVVCCLEYLRDSAKGASRHTCLIMTTDSLRDGNWTLRGFSAPSVGALRFCQLLSSQSLRLCFPLKADMS